MRKPLRYSLEDDKTEISNQYKNVAGYRCEVTGNIYDNPDLIKIERRPKHETYPATDRRT